MDKKDRSEAVSRILSPPPRLAALRRGDDHSSSLAIAGEIERPTRKLRMDHPSHANAFRRRMRASLFGLAPCGVLPATDLTAGAVRSYRTFSPLPRLRALRRVGVAVYFLCHYPSGHPDRALPGALPYGVRTFLPAFALARSGAAIVWLAAKI